MKCDECLFHRQFILIIYTYISVHYQIECWNFFAIRQINLIEILWIAFLAFYVFHISAKLSVYTVQFSNTCVAVYVLTCASMYCGWCVFCQSFTVLQKVFFPSTISWNSKHLVLFAETISFGIGIPLFYTIKEKNWVKSPFKNCRICPGISFKFCSHFLTVLIEFA